MDQEQNNQFYTDIGGKIRDIRVKQNITQEQLANAIRLSRSGIISIEKGRQKLYVHQLFEIVQALGTDIRMILPETMQSFDDAFEKLPFIYKHAVKQVLGDE